ncbi:hypothetical protein [Paracnuella aquatica]|uniref:hypothetical protein n=1 Tax=Paracnuella aquatica TaxID=2268757 RepID=UPI000F4E6ED1|nr:hypothetical protein [Paracnuella aquatica]RPD43873.1 hypothetical protein DRJ53_19010 [Paracnuella aquatica]
MKWISYSFLIAFFSSCTAVKVSVPQQFSSSATRLPIKGLNGWMVNQKLSFAQYQTSAIKRGWDFSSSVQYTRFGMRPEDFLLRVINIGTDRQLLAQHNKFQYTLSDGNNITEIYATEKFNEKDLVYKTDHALLGNVSATQRYEYAFTAAIVPVSAQTPEPWSLVMTHKYDSKKDTIRGLFYQPHIEEEGYATNGKEKIIIKPLRLQDVTTKSGKQTKVLGGPMLTGYELKWDDGLVAIIDIMDNSLWLYNDLEASDKLVLSSIASAILLKRMQDVEKDRDNVARSF